MVESFVPTCFFMCRQVPVRCSIHPHGSHSYSHPNLPLTSIYGSKQKSRDKTVTLCFNDKCPLCYIKHRKNNAKPYIYIYIIIIISNLSNDRSKPLPKRFLHTVRSKASSFNWQYPLLSLRLSSSFLRLLPLLLVTSICPLSFLQ